MLRNIITPNGMNAQSFDPANLSGENNRTSSFDRRKFLASSASVLAGAALAPAVRAADRDWSGKNTMRYPDPDIIVLDPRFAKYKVGNTPIMRLWTGALWAEGCAWHAGGRYLVWSDIPNNRQMRWLDD